MMSDDNAASASVVEDRDNVTSVLADADKDEESAISESLVFIDKFLNSVANRKDKLSSTSLQQLKTVKKKFISVIDEDNVVKGESQRVDKCYQGTGAIPKRKSQVRTKASDKKTSVGRRKMQVSSDTSVSEAKSVGSSDSGSSSDGDSDSSSPSSSSSSNSSVPSKPNYKSRNKKPNKKPVKKEKRSGTKYVKKDEFSKMLDAMSRMDTRPATSVEPFDEKAGINLRHYLEEFEVQCRLNFRSLPKFWIGELQTKLTGDALEAFRSVRTIDDTWESLKKKLVKWYETEKTGRKSKFKKEFMDVSLRKNESLYLLATRLEKVFKVAYPKKPASTSMTLIDRYMEIIPEETRGIFLSYVIQQRYKKSKPKWDKIKTLASYCTEDMTKRKPRPVTEEVLINIGSDKTRNDTFYEVSNDAKIDSPPYVVQGQIQQPSGTPLVPTPPSPLMRKNFQCSYCGRIGHLLVDCRIKNRTCFACGSTEHFIADCQFRKNLGQHSQSRSNYMSRNQENHTEGHSGFQPSSHPSLPPVSTPFYNYVDNGMPNHTTSVYPNVPSQSSRYSGNSYNGQHPGGSAPHNFVHPNPNLAPINRNANRDFDSTHYSRPNANAPSQPPYTARRETRSNARSYHSTTGNQFNARPSYQGPNRANNDRAGEPRTPEVKDTALAQ